MFKSLTRALGLAVFLCAAGAAQAAEKAEDKKDPVTLAAESARPMTIDELFRIYNDRTWIWEDGAGYFQAHKRRFISWVRRGRTASFGDGNWFMTQDGRICFRAKWHATDGAAIATTCFQHRTDGRNNYQRSWPDGEWYIFAHTPRRSGDEINKLKAGDQVTASFERNRKYIAENGVPQDFCSRKDPLVKAFCSLFGG
jgi:hypothetical protein